MTTRIIRPFHALAILALAVLALAVLASAHTVTRASAASTTTIHVSEKEFSIKLSKGSLARPGTVRFDVKNAGKMAHNFRINGKQTRLIKPGKTASLTVAFKKKTSYHYICAVPGHAALGMKGVFTVR
jgi:uncharacterized cupredoxin-like copper-binding protein